MKSTASKSSSKTDKSKEVIKTKAAKKAVPSLQNLENLHSRVPPELPTLPDNYEERPPAPATLNNASTPVEVVGGMAQKLLQEYKKNIDMLKKQRQVIEDEMPTDPSGDDEYYEQEVEEDWDDQGIEDWFGDADAEPYADPALLIQARKLVEEAAEKARKKRADEAAAAAAAALDPTPGTSKDDEDGALHDLLKEHQLGLEEPTGSPILSRLATHMEGL